MSFPHFFIQQSIKGSVGECVSLALSDGVMGHLSTLRLKAGEYVVLVDRPGHAWNALLNSDPSRKKGVLEGTLLSEISSMKKADLTLVQGISAADRMDQTIRQVTELGISRVIPLESERSNVRLDDEAREKKQARWLKVAQGAAEQSCQLYCPTIERPVDLEKALAMLEGYDLLLFFWEEAEGCPLAEVFAGFKGPLHIKTAVFIGPEGGFSQDEAYRFGALGAYTVSLGPTILRTETAALVASALVLYHLGALGAR